MKKRLISLACLGFFGLLGCSGAPVGNRLNLLQPYGDDTMVVDSGLEGRQSLTVSLLSPQNGNFRSQAVVHRWTSQDVYQYELLLSGGGLPAPLLATLVPSSGKSKAAFTHLKANTAQPYTLTVTARGNVGGTAPERILNSQNPASKVFSFMGDNDIEDTQNLSFTLQLDDVPFNGTADIGLQPIDGGYSGSGDATVSTGPASDSPTPAPTATPQPNPTPTTPAGEGFFNLRIRFDQ